jgi:Na+-transporting NADH:ubiquinone oxidoreductase subunit NqrB
MLFRDVRDFQILFLSVFLFLGIYTRDWTLRIDLISIIFLVCIATQITLSSLTQFFRQPEEYRLNPSNHALDWLSLTSLRSAIITSLGLCLLLRANSPTTVAIAAFLAIASKFLFQIHGKHFFNPANFGIVAAIILTKDAWISPGQWGADWLYLLLFAGLGGMIVKKVGRWDTTGTFLLSYAGFEAVRNCYLGWTWDVLQHQLMSGSLLLFALFMITDPRSIPNARIGRCIWAIAIAFVAFILQHQFYITTGVFWALFLLSPVTIAIDNLWNSPRFNWQFYLKSEV